MLINLICDAIIVVIMLFCILKGRHDGLIKTAFKPKRIYAFIFAYAFSSKLADYIGERYIYPFAHDRLHGAISAAFVEKAPTKDELMASIPSFFRKVASICNIDVNAIADAAFAKEADVIETFSSSIAEFATGFISLIVAFLAIFIGAKIGLRLVEFILSKVVKLPVLGTANKIGGICFGVVWALLFGLVFSYIIGYGVGALSLGDKFAYLGTFDIEKTWIIKYFVGFNPFKWFV